MVREDRLDPERDGRLVQRWQARWPLVTPEAPPGRADGIHYWVSGKHLDCHLVEFTFRHGRRQMGAGQRVGALLGQIEGRLTYKALIA